jgi:hypothetical protein
MGVLSSIMFAVSVTIGQAEKPVDPSLQELAPLVGTWTGTFDVPEMTIKEADVTYSWSIDGKYLEARWSTRDGKDLGPELFTFDPISKTFRMWGFDPDSFYEATWQIEGKKWTGQYAGTRFTGERTKNSIVLEFEGSSTVAMKFIPEGGDKAIGVGKMTRANKQPASLQHLEAFMKDFGGDWVNESVAEESVGPVKAGEKFTAYHSYKWSPDKESVYLTYSAEFGGKTFDTTKGLVGWDAVKKAVVLRWFDSLGSSGDMIFTKDGQGWKYRWSSTDPNGAEYLWNGTITLDVGIQRVHETNRKIKGEAKPDHELTWKRRS